MRLLDAWDLRIEPLPPRTRLYSLAPVGIGTAWVESLASYVARLAEAHCINVADLIALELSRRAASAPLVTDGFRPQTYAINGVGEAPRRWCRALEEATGRDDLSNLTLVGLDELIWQSYLFRRTRAWCPRCLADRQQTGFAVYEPLLWAIRTVRRCPRHWEFLQEICPHCHRASIALTAYSRLGFCSRCQRWLGSTACGKTAEQVLSQPEFEYEIWLSNQTGDLLALASQLKGVALGPRLRDNLFPYIDRLTAGNLEEFARITKTSRMVVRGLMTAKHRSRIDLLLRLCSSLRIPVRNLLEDNSTPNIATGFSRRRRLGRNQRRRPEILRALQEALVEEPPPMLAGVARRLNHDRSESLCRVAPELCRKIVVRHQKAVNRLPRKGRPRICAKNEIRKSLVASLMRPQPTSVQRVAVKLGYCNAGCLRLEFPDLCRAIGKKLARVKRNRLRQRQQEFARILKEQPLPSTTRVSRRLGYRIPLTLRFNFPEQYRALLAKRKAERANARETIRLQIEHLLSEEPPISVSDVCRRVGLSASCLYKRYSDLCRAIASKRRQHWKAVIADRIKRLRKAVFAAVSQLDRQGIYPTHDRVRSFLDADLKKQWVDLTRFVGQAKCQLGIPTRPLSGRMAGPPAIVPEPGALTNRRRLQV
jgi:hypothetical protein